MAAKTARVYTLDELKKKIPQEVLDNPKLVEIAKTSSSPSRAYKEAEKYIHEQTKDLQKTKELAGGTRFLAMLRRDFAEEFERLIAQEKQPKPETKPVEPKKSFSEMEFTLPCYRPKNSYYADNFGMVEVIFRNRPGSNRSSLKFYSTMDDDSSARGVGEKFCLEILNALIETADPSGDMDLMNDLIQLLEEKLGLKVKVCGNCNNFVYRSDCRVFHKTRLERGNAVNFPNLSQDGPFAECTINLWALKEAPVDKE